MVVPELFDSPNSERFLRTSDEQHSHDHSFAHTYQFLRKYFRDKFKHRIFSFER